jgi:hypothetical protein
MAYEVRQPAGTMRGIGTIIDHDQVIGDARVSLQFFSIRSIADEAATSTVIRQDREVYGEGELLADGRIPETGSLTLRLRDGRAIPFAAIPHGHGYRFEIVPVA